MKNQGCCFLCFFVAVCMCVCYVSTAIYRLNGLSLVQTSPLPMYFFRERTLGFLHQLLAKVRLASRGDFKMLLFSFFFFYSNIFLIFCKMHTCVKTIRATNQTELRIVQRIYLSTYTCMCLILMQHTRKFLDPLPTHSPVLPFFSSFFCSFHHPVFLRTLKIFFAFTVYSCARKWGAHCVSAKIVFVIDALKFFDNFTDLMNGVKNIGTCLSMILTGPFRLLSSSSTVSSHVSVQLSNHQLPVCISYSF